MNTKRHLTLQLPLALRVALLYGGVFVFGATASLTQPPAQPSVVQAAEISRHVVAENPHPPEKPVQTGLPVGITAPTVGIDLDVISGTYDKATDTWTLTDDSAQFATMTSQPNDDTGNTFIYGHATTAVFAPLVNLKSGDTVTITTINELSFVYRYNGATLVDPTTTSILLPTDKPQLTLMMCEGFNDQHRRVMTFDFVEVIS